ncbi:imidazolonepropionase [Citreicella sp. C3M06]|uniref:imidazolonepropionase n=1 Tax=Citreicella sp. C3M06 TaxID=2841564 RepID=UPI001C09BFA8|nr:imidazolonepropionase [Citreicella sp. C3M06]MBU2961247.1 imidazolonepropionase [Citreicella sp. C3M06]
MQTLWTNAQVVTGKDGVTAEPLDVVTENGRITAVGSGLKADHVVDCGGALMTPGLVDCHTHIIHGGDRAREFELRLEGASYEKIAREGGGIAATVAATRALSEDDLLEQALPRLDALLAEGVTTIEVKSGYGLEIETELRMLRAARRLASERRVRVVTTWLAAHALPAGTTDRAAYIDDICIEGLNRAHADGLVDAVDGFCESIAFSTEELEPLFERAADLGLPVKLHAEQLSRQGGCRMAARHGALSVDHVEYAAGPDASALAKAGTVAVLLPGAFYMLRETRLPPVQAFREAGVPMALATDCNPGTSPLTSLLLTMNMGATLFRMTVPECLAGVTSVGAQALGLADVGVIAPGMAADFCLWNADSAAQLVARIGFNPLKHRVFAGEIA